MEQEPDTTESLLSRTIKLLNERGAELCDLVEALLRKGDDCVPERLRDVTESQVVDAMYALRAVLAKAVQS